MNLTSPFKSLLECLFGLTICLLTAEGTLRIMDYPSNLDQAIPLPYIIPDTKLGWKNAPGTYVLQASGTQELSQVTIWPDGSRATGEEIDKKGPRLIILGCSFVLGYGLSDNQTFPWKLQSKLPHLSIRNLGVPGYGSVTAQMLLDDYLHNDDASGETVLIIYGFADFHPNRGIKNPLSQRFWDNPGFFPYCDWEQCEIWSGKRMTGVLRSLRTFSIFENAWDTIQVRSQETTADYVTIEKLKQMQQLSQRIGATFVITPVSWVENRWGEIFETAGIPVVDCSLPLLNGDTFRLEDGHPNESWSEVFAECLSRRLVDFSAKKQGAIEF